MSTSTALWISKAGGAVLDQALLAGSHFLLNVMLARWIHAAEYGVFALGYSIFAFVAALQSAVITQPLTIFGSAKYLAESRSYLGQVVRGHVALTLIPCSLMLVITLLAPAWPSATVSQALSGVAVAGPLITFLWLLRSAFYVRSGPGWALVAGATYSVCLLSLAAGLHHAGWLSARTALYAMGLAALAASAISMLQLQPHFFRPSEALKASQIAREHWAFGRWAIASSVTTWLPLNIYYMLLPRWFSLDDAGALKALINLANPLLHTLLAMTLLLTPLLVRRLKEDGPDSMLRLVRSSSALLVGIALLYLLITAVFGSEMMRFLYGNQYDRWYGPQQLMLVGLLPVGAALSVVLGCALRALERPDAVFWGGCCASAVALSVGAPLTFLSGSSGALAAMFVSYIASALVMVVFIRRATST